MTSPDPRKEFLSRLASELRCGPLARRRVLKELAHHMDDAAADLRAGGLPPQAALHEALRRLGEPASIAQAFTVVPRRRGRRKHARTLRSPAWIAVGVMSVVTLGAAELPQASGAEAASARQLHGAHLRRPDPHRALVQRRRSGHR